MADVANKQKAGAPFLGGQSHVEVTYDFAEDAGAVGVLDLVEMESDAVLVGFYAIVDTACTSGGSMTLDCGVKAGDTNLLLDGVAVASLTADSLHQPFIVEGAPNVLPMPVRLASGDILSMEILTAALTAGKIRFRFVFEKA